MKQGLIFITTHKQLSAQILEIFEEKGFHYVENIAIVQLSGDSISQVIARQEKQKKSKKGSLFQFYKSSSPNKPELETVEMKKNDKGDDGLDSLPEECCPSDVLGSFLAKKSPIFKNSKQTILILRKVSPTFYHY